MATKLVESPNKAVKKSLIETIQQKDAKLYDALQRMNADLDKTYETLFGGPIDVSNFDGVIDEVNLPANIAFQDRVNTFTENIILAVSKAIYAGSVAVANLRFYVDATLAIIRIGPGGRFGWQNSVGADIGTVFPSGAIHAYGAGVDPGAAGFYVANSSPFKSLNAGGTGYFHLLSLDVNNVLRLGEDAVATGQGHVGIPAKTDVNLPPAGAANDGIIVIDKTNNRLCFYHSGARYYVTGTAF